MAKKEKQSRFPVFMNSPLQDYYSTVLNWAKQLINPNATVLVGVNGPQGCGKTTLCNALVSALSKENISSAALSIDDFYLTREEQVALALRFSENPYLQQRGYPGTHDVALGVKTLLQLKKLKKSGSVLCPQYDKSAHQGKGDRFPENLAKKVVGPLDILFFEGWMLGFSPVEESFLSDPHLIQINKLLKTYAAWDAQLDAFISLVPEEINYVLDWRVEAEEKRKASGLSGMSTREIKDYIQKFLPAYHTYLPQLNNNPPATKHFLTFRLKKNRLPVS